MRAAFGERPFGQTGEAWVEGEERKEEEEEEVSGGVLSPREGRDASGQKAVLWSVCPSYTRG